MGPLKSFHKFFEGVRLSAPKKLDQKSAVAPPACCGCSLAPIQKVALSFLSASQTPISEHRRDLSVSLHVSSGPLPIDPGR